MASSSIFCNALEACTNTIKQIDWCSLSNTTTTSDVFFRCGHHHSCQPVHSKLRQNRRRQNGKIQFTFLLRKRRNGRKRKRDQNMKCAQMYFFRIFRSTVFKLRSVRLGTTIGSVMRAGSHMETCEVRLPYPDFYHLSRPFNNIQTS